MTAGRNVDDVAARIVDEAWSWVGTPYRHQAAAKGHGADCLGLVRGVWRALYGREPERPPPYSADWMETTGEERLWEAAKRLLAPADRARPGDILLFRMAARAPAKHLAILSAEAPERIIHAYSGRAVLESPLTESWRRRVVAAFRFPRSSD
jgi:NlpC/P60 family putative phage cell wall peptidase